MTVIPCTNLCIGSWRRIATAISKHDLVAYICEAKQCITWFIQSSGHGFKMEIPFDIVVHTSFSNLAPGMGLATLRLSRPPVFYLERVVPSSLKGPATKYWERCADWTEGMQATKILIHELTGSAVQLAHILRYLNSSNMGMRLSVGSTHVPAGGHALNRSLPLPMGMQDQRHPDVLHPASRMPSRPDCRQLARPASMHSGAPASEARRSATMPMDYQLPRTESQPLLAMPRPLSGPFEKLHSSREDYPFLQHQQPPLDDANHRSPYCPPGSGIAAQHPYRAPGSRADSPYDYPGEPPLSASASSYDTPSPPVLDTPYLSPHWQESGMEYPPLSYSGDCMTSVEPHPNNLLPPFAYQQDSDTVGPEDAKMGASSFQGPIG